MEKVTEKSPSIRFRRGRRSSRASIGEQINEPESVVEVELLDITDDGSSEGVDNSNSDEIPGEIKLLYAAHEGDLEGIKDLLASGVNVNYRDIDDRTAMHVAACQGYIEVVEFLIDNGAEVDATDRWGSTPLADSIHYKNLQVARILEKHGAVSQADPSTEDELKVPEYEIDPQEIDFTNSDDTSEGTFLKASWRGIQVAVKKIDEISTDEDTRMAFRDELAVLQRVRHPNVVQFLGAVTQGSTKMIVTEYFPKGGLHAYLKEQGQLKPRVAIEFALDIARGMGYLHENKPEAIIHGDLQPANILWDISGTVKVADFGVSKLLNAAKGVVGHEPHACKSVECQSGRYMAPELFKNEGYNTKVDVFSFALILQEMIEGCPPFPEMNDAEVAAAYADGQRPPFKASAKLYAHGLKELIEQCLSQEPAERPIFREIIIKLNKISHTLGHKNRWKVQIHTISKTLSSGVFGFHHKK